MSTVLLILAVLPGIIIMFKVYRMDKIEKEPFGLILLLMILGAISCIPVAVVEGLLGNAFASVFPAGRFLRLIDNFIGVALIEEGAKFLVTRICTWKNKNFNYVFDAIVYTVSAALGFAIFENIFYVSAGGIKVALLRAVLSVPGHAIFGLFMGLYYGAAKVCMVRGNKARQRRFMWTAVLVPTVLHGIYDFCLSDQTYIALIAFIVFVAVLYTRAWKLLKKESIEDMPLESAE